MGFKEDIESIERVGLSGFPVAQDSKKPLVAWKQYQDVSPTKREIEAWISWWPLARVGIPCGDIVVLDADNLEAIRYVFKKGIPPTWCCPTRRGTHYYFRAPKGLVVRNSTSEIAPHLDLKAKGGYVIWRPWLRDYCPDRVPLADAPKWLIDHLEEKERQRTPAAPAAPARTFAGGITPWAEAVWRGELERLAAARNGTRNDTANRVAFVLGRLIGGGELPESQVSQSLIEVAAQWRDENFSATLHRALEQGKQQPRRKERSA